jgi:hypothetical protein
VKAPNGKQSLLYNSAAMYAGKSATALKLWGLAYSQKFMDRFGDWMKSPEKYLLDSNGEPGLGDVLHFIQISRAENKRLDKEDVRDIGNAMAGLGTDSYDAFYERIYQAFYVNGIFSVDGKRLSDSGIYTDEEVYDLLHDTDLQEGVRDLLDRMQGDFLSDSDVHSRVEGMEVGDYPVQVYGSRKTRAGKYEALNPAIVDSTLAERLGGISDRELFAEAVYDLPYETVIERYESDSVFAEELYKRYSVYSEVPAVDISEEGIVQQKNGSLSDQLVSFENTESVERSIDMLTSVRSEEWENRSRIVSLLRKIAKEAARSGLDLSALPGMYDVKPMEEIQDFLASTDVFLTDQDITAFGEVYDSFFGIEHTPVSEKMLLDKGLRGLSIVRIRKGAAFNPHGVDLFEGYGLVYLGNDLYHKVDPDVSTGTLYEDLYAMAINDPSILPVEAYYPAGFRKGAFSREKLADPKNRDRVLDSMKAHILGQIQKYNGPVGEGTEKLILYKTLFGHPLNVEAEVDTALELAKYHSLRRERGDYYDLTYAFPVRFARYVLEEKVRDSDVYRYALSHFAVSENDSVSLKDTDAYSIREIEEWMPAGKMREDLRQYAYLSRDASLQGLFVRETETGAMDSMKFRQWLYVNHPGLLPNYTSDYTANRETGLTEVRNMFDDFIKIDGAVHYLKGQHNEYGFYDVAGFMDFSGMKTYDLYSMTFNSPVEGVRNTEAKEGRLLSERALYGSGEGISILKKHAC